MNIPINFLTLPTVNLSPEEQLLPNNQQIILCTKKNADYEKFYADLANFIKTVSADEKNLFLIFKIIQNHPDCINLIKNSL